MKIEEPLPMGQDHATYEYDEKQYEAFVGKQNEELLGKGQSSWPAPYGSLFSDSIKTHTAIAPVNSTTAVDFTAITEEERRQAVAALQIFNRIARKQSDVFNTLMQQISTNDKRRTAMSGSTVLYQQSIAEGKSKEDARRDNVWCSDRIFMLAAAMRNAQEQQTQIGQVLKGPTLLNLRSLDLSNCGDLNLSYVNGRNYFIGHSDYLQIDQKVHVGLNNPGHSRRGDVLFGSIVTSRVPKNTVNVMYDDGKISYGVPSRYLLGSNKDSPANNGESDHVNPWQRVGVGRAYYGDRGATPAAWSSYLMSPMPLTLFKPFYIQQQITIMIDTYYGCELTVSHSTLVREVLSSLSYDPHDTNYEDWMVLPITCELNKEEERSTYSLILLQWTDQHEEEEEEEEEEEVDQKKPQRNRRTVLRFKVRCLATAGTTARPSFFPTKYNTDTNFSVADATKTLEENELKFPKGLSPPLRNDGASIRGTNQAHVLTAVTSDNAVVTELPSSLLSSCLSIPHAQPGKRIFSTLKDIFQTIVETRQTKILSTSLSSTDAVDSLYSVPAFLGSTASPLLCRVLMKETCPSNHGEDEEKYTIMLSDGSVEYNVSRESISLTETETMNERAYLNVHDSNVRLTLESKIPTSSNVLLTHTNSKTGEHKLLKLSHVGQGSSNGPVYEKSVVLSNKDVQYLHKEHIESSVVRMMPSLNVGDRVQTSESSNMYHRSTVRSINNSTYVFQTVDGNVKDQLKRFDFFLERDSEMKLAQISAASLLKSSKESAGSSGSSGSSDGSPRKVFYPTEPMNATMRVLVRVDCETLLPSSTGTLLLIDEIADVRLFQREGQEPGTQEQEQRYQYKTKSYSSQWMQRGFMINAYYPIPSRAILSQHGITAPLVAKMLKYTTRRKGYLTNNPDNSHSMNVRYNQDESISNICRSNNFLLHSGTLAATAWQRHQTPVSLSPHHGTYGMNFNEFAKILRSVPQVKTSVTTASSGEEIKVDKTTYTYDIELENGRVMQGQQRYRFWVNVAPGTYPILPLGQVVLIRPGGVSDMMFYGVVNGPPAVEATATSTAASGGESMVPICFVRTGTNSHLLKHLKAHGPQLSTSNYTNTTNDYVVSGGSTLSELYVQRSFLQPMSDEEPLCSGLEIKRTAQVGPECWCNASIKEPLMEAELIQCNVPLAAQHKACGEDEVDQQVDYDVLMDGEILRHCKAEDLIVAQPGLRVAVYPNGWEWPEHVYIPSCKEFNGTSTANVTNDYSRVELPKKDHGVIVDVKTAQDNHKFNQYNVDVFPGEDNEARPPSVGPGPTCSVELDSPIDGVCKILVVHTIPSTAATTSAAASATSATSATIASGKDGVVDSDEDSYKAITTVAYALENMSSTKKEQYFGGMEEMLGWRTRNKMSISIEVVSLCSMEKDIEKLNNSIERNKQHLDSHKEKLHETDANLSKLGNNADDEEDTDATKEVKAKKMKLEKDRETLIGKIKSVTKNMNVLIKERSNKNDFSSYDGCVYLAKDGNHSCAQPTATLKKHGYMGNVLTMIVAEDALKTQPEGPEEKNQEGTPPTTPITAAMEIPVLRIDNFTNQTVNDGSGHSLYSCLVCSTMHLKYLLAPVVDYIRHDCRLYNISLQDKTTVLPLEAAPASTTSSASTSGNNDNRLLRCGTVAWSRRSYNGCVLQTNDGTYDVKEYGTGDVINVDPSIDDIKSESVHDDNHSMRELFIQSRVAIRSLNLSSTTMDPLLIASDLYDFVRAYSTNEEEEKENDTFMVTEQGKEPRPKNSIILEPMGKERKHNIMETMGGYYRLQPMIQSLILSDMKLGTKGIRILCSGLMSNTSVTELNVSHNAIKDKGCLYVSQVLRKHPALTSLNLSHNLLTGTSATLLANNISKYQIGTIVGITPQSLTVKQCKNDQVVHNVATSTILLKKNDIVYQEQGKDQYNRVLPLVQRKVSSNQKLGETTVLVLGDVGERKENHHVVVERKDLHLSWRSINQIKHRGVVRQLQRSTPLLGLIAKQAPPEPNPLVNENTIAWNDFKIDLVCKKVYTENEFRQSENVDEHTYEKCDKKTGMYRRPVEQRRQGDGKEEKVTTQQYIYFKEEDWGLRNGKCIVYEILNNAKHEIISITSKYCYRCRCCAVFTAYTDMEYNNFFSFCSTSLRCEIVENAT